MMTHEHTHSFLKGSKHDKQTASSGDAWACDGATHIQDGLIPHRHWEVSFPVTPAQSLAVKSYRVTWPGLALSAWRLEELILKAAQGGNDVVILWSKRNNLNSLIKN